MSNYTVTITPDIIRSEQISRNLALYLGECDISQYDSNGISIHEITGHFLEIINVLCDTLSSNGYFVSWDRDAKYFRAYEVGTGDEVALDTNVGTINFVAIGLLPDIIV